MKIGLALSGGGALGAAHIGVIEELEKNNIKIDEIAGTSAGSIVAGIYASGGIDAVNKFFDEISAMEIFNQKRPFKIVTPTRFFELVFETIDKYTADKIEDTKIPLHIAATDLRSGEPVIFSAGDMIQAIRASSAYPGVFPIQKFNSHELIDGGITSNLPSTAIRDKVDFLIGSNLYEINNLSSSAMVKLNRARILLRSIDIIQKQLADLYARECDFCFNLNFQPLRWYSFNKIGEIRKSGSRAATEQINDLIQKINS